MPSGTKITLTMITLLVSVLVLYYGFIMPTPEPVRVTAAGEAAVASDPTAPAGANPVAETTRTAKKSDASRRAKPRVRAAPAPGKNTTSTPASPARRRAPVVARDEAEVRPVTVPPAEAARLRAAADTLTSAGGGATGLPAMRVAQQPIATAGPQPGDTPAKAAGNDGATSERPPPDAAASAKTAGRAGVDGPPAVTGVSRPSLSDADTAGTTPPDRPVVRRSAATPTPPRYARYVVEPGDTMSSIAADWFGDERKWDLIAKANLVDPNRLRVGQVLRLPPKEASREPLHGRAAQRVVTYTVRSGDTLSSIAAALYGESSRWEDLYRANRGLIGTNANDLQVGMELRVPR